MKKRYLVAGVISILVLGTCTLPFLPVSGYVFLKNYEKTVKLGPYDIESRILLFDNEDETEMSIHATFTYPAAKMKIDGCYFKVTASLEGQTSQKYPAHVVNTEYEKNFPIENTSDSSIDDTTEVGELRRLILTLYNEPIVEQKYILELNSINEVKSETCNSKKIITHKINYYRASPFSIAMGV